MPKVYKAFVILGITREYGDYGDTPVLPCFKPRPRRVLEEDPLSAVPALSVVMRGAGDDDAGDSGHEPSGAGRE